MKETTAHHSHAHRLAINKNKLMLEDVALDLLGEETDQMRKTTKVNKWDPKKRNYVMMTVSAYSANKSLKQLRNESGKKISVKAKEDDSYDSILISNRWADLYTLQIQEMERKDTFANPEYR